MAITMQQINAFRNLDAFKAFADTKDNGDSIVHFAQANRGLSIDTNDRIRGFTTWTAPNRNIEANRATREAFKNSLLALFGKQELAQLPDAVKDVLKSGDFDGTGKPLSVRRIKAVMNVVVETAEYQKTSEYAALTSFTDAKLGTTANDTMDSIIQKNMDFCANLTTSGRQQGGNLINVLDTIGGGLGMESMKSATVGFFTGIQVALKHGGSLNFSTDKIIGQGRFGNLPKKECITVARSGNSIKDLDAFFDAWKTYAMTKFRAENRNADTKTVETALKAITNEVKKLVDKLKIRMAALECLDSMPGTTTAEKVKNFTTITTLIKKEDKDITADELKSKACQLAPMLFYKIDRSKLEQAKTELAAYLVNEFKIAKAKGGAQLNPVTGVNALTLRELNDKPFSINGKLIPEVNPDVLSEGVVVHGANANELNPNVWKSGNTGVTGAASDKAVGSHKALCKAIPDRRMREFVSDIISMTLGVKGFFESQIERNGTEGDTLNLFGNGRTGTIPMSENNIIVVPIPGSVSGDSYAITTNDVGDVLVTAKFSVGTQAMPRNEAVGEIYSKTDFEVTIDLKPVFNEQGIPQMNILGIDVVD
ncbi:MAG: hypothetical protein MJ240_01935 [Kiritimatiellae bacterium]|nr:hypothetical protein [Kiritimatiellia bacterium]